MLTSAAKLLLHRSIAVHCLPVFSSHVLLLSDIKVGCFIPSAEVTGSFIYDVSLNDASPYENELDASNELKNLHVDVKEL